MKRNLMLSKEQKKLPLIPWNNGGDPASPEVPSPTFPSTQVAVSNHTGSGPVLQEQPSQ